MMSSPFDNPSILTPNKGDITELDQIHWDLEIQLENSLVQHFLYDRYVMIFRGI